MDLEENLGDPHPEESTEQKAPETDAVNGASTEAMAEKRVVSSIEFPYNDLSDAISVAKAIHALGGKPELDQLAPAMSYTSVTNGAFKNKLAASKKFGIVNVTGASPSSEASLTELGRRILLDETTAQAKVEAFLNVALFKKVYDQYRGQVLPPDAGLENFIVQVGVSPKQKDKARSTLQKSAQAAGFFVSGRTRLVMPSIVQSSPPSGQNVADLGDTNPGDLAMLTRRIDELERENERLRSNGNVFLPSELPQAILGVLTTLPLTDDDKWSQEDLKEWTAMFETVVKRAFRHRISAT